MTREASLPESSILVKKISETSENLPPKSKIQITTKPYLSRDRVDKALQILKKSPVQTSPLIYPRVRLSKLNRTESLASAKKAPDLSKISGPRCVTSYCEIRLPKCWCVL